MILLLLKNKKIKNFSLQIKFDRENVRLINREQIYRYFFKYLIQENKVCSKNTELFDINEK